MENWTDIHEDFAKKDYLEDYPFKTYQQLWEENNLTYQDAQQWIPVGLEPKYDYNLAFNLKQNNITPEQYTNYKNKSPQEQLDYFFNKNQVEAIYLTGLKFNQSGELMINDYPNLKVIRNSKYNIPNLTQLTITNCPQLEEMYTKASKNLQQLTLNNLPNLKRLDCSKNSLTTLEINNCANLESIYCYRNQLTQIKLPQGEKLEELWLNSNNLSQVLSFLSDLVGLKWLCLNNNHFHGNLEYLQDMSELKALWINDTDIDSGLEYLPKSVKYFYCSADIRKEAKVKAIYNLFANKQGIVETDSNGGIKNFPQKFQDYKQWRKLNFTEETIKQWIKTGLTINEYDFVSYLRWGNISLQKAKNDLVKLKERYIREWKEWEKQGFTYEQTKEWINAGAKADDYGFIVWLRDTKKETPEWITNYQEDYQILSERFKKYGLCLECSQPNTGEQWCKDCNAPHLQENFTKWTSHNPQVDEFIQKYQLEATDTDKFLEWVPYEQFTGIEYLAEGGFGKVYKAKWTKGNVHHWDNKKKQWQREKDHYYDDENKKKWDFEWNKDKYKKYKTYREVVLKSLNNSQNNTDFLDETAKHKIIDDWFNNIVPCYGISQEPATNNYLMVMKYIEGGDLRKYLKSKNLSFKDKLSRLVNIAQGLKDIHQKDLVHRDFHSGNILNSDIHSFITDLGLCKPVNETNKEEGIYGVLPYVAPEVLNKKSYTLASDIYSWGMVAYEVISGLPPYPDLPHNNYLAIKICQGVRPRFRVKIPSLLKSLIERCWDADPAKRPTANELNRILNNWVGEVDSQKNTEFFRQFKEREQFLNNLTSLDYKIHPSAFYTSRRLDFENLPEPQNSKEINDLFYSGDSGQDSLEIPANIGQPKLNEETQQSEQQAQILQKEPYGTHSSSKNN